MLMFMLGMSLGTCLGVVVTGIVKGERDPSPDDRQTAGGQEIACVASPASDTRAPLH